MAPAKKKVTSAPDWPAEKSLTILRRQVDELSQLKTRTDREVYQLKQIWAGSTRAAILHAFGEGSPNVSNFNFAYLARRGRNEHDDFIAVSEQEEIVLRSAIAELQMMTELPVEKSSETPNEQPLKLFISHSSEDGRLAATIVELFKAGLALRSDEIRCSSLDGYRLPVGARTEEQLRKEVNSASVVVALLTPSSMASAYVMFELGARWGAGNFLAPLLAGIAARKLVGPLSLLNALSCQSDSQLHQLLEDVARHLNISIQPASSYASHIEAARSECEKNYVLNEQGNKRLPHSKTSEPLSFRATVQGEPPNQSIHIAANHPITVKRLDYLLTSEVAVVGEDFSATGETIAVPIRHESLNKLYNMDRPDMNGRDRSGPIKLRITLALNGNDRDYIMPAQLIQFSINNRDFYRKLLASKIFSD